MIVALKGPLTIYLLNQHITLYLDSVKETKMRKMMFTNSILRETFHGSRGILSQIKLKLPSIRKNSERI